MPKQPASGKTKVNAFIRDFHNEFISTPTDELFCKLCEKVVKHDKRFHVDQHRNGSVHRAKLTIPTTSRQSFISTPNIPNFIKCPKANNNCSAYWRLYQKITNWKEEFCAATFRFCIIYDSRWKGIKVTLQQFISRYLSRASPSQLRRKNQKQV